MNIWNWVYALAGLIGLIILGVSFFQWNNYRNDAMNALYALGLVLFLIATSMVLIQDDTMSKTVLVGLLTLANFSLLYGMLIWAQKNNGYSNTGLLATSHIITWVVLLGMLVSLWFGRPSLLNLVKLE